MLNKETESRDFMTASKLSVMKTVFPYGMFYNSGIRNINNIVDSLLYSL
jgi:hypothetical protein